MVAEAGYLKRWGYFKVEFNKRLIKEFNSARLVEEESSVISNVTEGRPEEVSASTWIRGKGESGLLGCLESSGTST